MLRTLYKILLVSSSITLTLPSLVLQPSLAQAPSLDDGILCVARGKTPQGNRIYFYTSVIDDDAVKKKTPVSVTINEPVVTIDADELVVVNSDTDTVTILDSVTATPPEMKPVGEGRVIYQGNNTFTGKTKAGNSLSFTLGSNYKTFTLKHGNQTFKGSCH